MDLAFHRGTGAITYKGVGWQQAGLTKVDWERASMDNFYFRQSFQAAQFILDNVDKTTNGAVNIPIPKDFPTRVIMPDGTFRAATHIRLIPSGGGVKTAYPLIP